MLQLENPNHWNSARTLSPYLFLILMTAIFHDVHDDQQLETEFAANRPIGYDSDEILYADDTLVLGSSKSDVGEMAAAVGQAGTLEATGTSLHSTVLKSRTSDLYLTLAG